MKKDYLPLGSIVLLKGGNKRLMICGRLQKRESSGEVFDYCGCLYPEGIIRSNQMYFFNNEDIETLFFIGFQEEEELHFRSVLNNLEIEE